VLSLAGERRLVEVDPDRIEQIVANLLENAVKYAPDGGEVQVSLEPEADGMLVRVRDRGIGIPDGWAERIFQPFGRASNAIGAHISGLGLGLYLCRQIAEQHGGRLWAESHGEGQGTTVLLWLPFETSIAGALAGE
jgi:two-component system sensor histidine kinase VicK